MNDRTEQVAGDIRCKVINLYCEGRLGLVIQWLHNGHIALYFSPPLHAKQLSFPSVAGVFFIIIISNPY